MTPFTPNLLLEDKNLGTFKHIKGVVHDNLIDKSYPIPTSIQQSIAQTASYKFNTIELSFKNELLKIIKSLQTKRIDVLNASIKAEKLLTLYYKRAYGVGLSSSGTDISLSKGFGTGFRNSLIPEENTWINTAIKQEVAYLIKFLTEIDSGYSSRIPIYKRVEMYVESLRAQFDAGKVVGAPQFSFIYWKTTPAEHCKVCLWLEKYSPWLKETLPTTPKAGGTSCSIGCKCQLDIQQVPYKEYLVQKNNGMLRTVALAKIKQLNK